MEDAHGSLSPPGAGAAAGPVGAAFLSAVTTGQLQDLPLEAETAAQADDDDPMTGEQAAPRPPPCLPLLARLQYTRRVASSKTPLRPRSKDRSAAAAAVVDRLLLRQEASNVLRAYAQVFGRLKLHDLHKFALERQETGTELPIYRQFESGDTWTRACLVLSEVRAFADAGGGTSPQLGRNELFTNDIYRTEVAAILSMAVASSGLQQSGTTTPFERSTVVQFCLSVPLGAALLAELVENDPASVELVLETMAAALARLTTGQSLAQQERDACALATELPVEVVNIQDACVSLARMSPLFAELVRDKLHDVDSLWAVAVVLHLHSTLPELRDDATLFLHQWMRDAASPVPAFFHIAASSRSNDTPGERSTPSPFQQIAEHLLELFKDQLLDDLESTSTGQGMLPLKLTVTLDVWIALLSLNGFRLTDHEAMRLLRSLDKLAKAPSPPSERACSLAYIVALLVCYPLAPALGKIPSQRDESTKVVVSLAQHSIFSLYSTKMASPMMIVSAVLLYTKSPALISFLSAVAGGGSSSSYGGIVSLRVEYLHVFGDIVLKPILTENLMARDVLTCVPPALSARNHDPLQDMTLRAVYGLLCEKSFLRYHHGRKLETWLAQLIGGDLAGPEVPVHPLMVNLLLEWIDNYVMAFEYPISQTPTLQLSIVPLKATHAYRWLSAPCLQGDFSPADTTDDKSAWARGLLVLTYALQFNQRVRQATMVPGSKISSLSTDVFAAPGGDIIVSYDLDQFPLRNMLHQALAHSGVGQAFEFVTPTLHRLLLEEYPSWTPVTNFDPQSDRDVTSAWFRRRCTLLSVKRCMDEKGGALSWSSLTFMAAKLQFAPIQVLVEDFKLFAASLLPQAMLTLHQGQSADALSFCGIMTVLYTTRVRDSRLNDTSVLLRLVHTLCFPDWVVKQYSQQHRHHARMKTGTTARLPLVVTYNQLLEEPFRLIKDADSIVHQVPPLLQLLLVLVRDVRVASNVRLTKRDPTITLLRGSQQQQLPDGISTKAATMVQHQLVQDCLLVHALLSQLAATLPKLGGGIDDAEIQGIEASRLLCELVNELFAEDEQQTDGNTTPPRLLTAVHVQGYDIRVISLLVEHVPSLRLLWEFWMSSGGSASSSSTSGRSSNSSKPLTEFLFGESSSSSGGVAIIEKNVPRFAFRLRVFLLLCSKYFVTRHNAVVLPAMKLVWNKLRSALNATIGSMSTSPVSVSSVTAVPGQAIVHQRINAAFLHDILPLAANASSRHPELTTELVQFLLKVQKMQASASTSSTDNGDTGRRQADSGAQRSELEDALHDAYRSLIRQL